ncbi:potassium/sodium hyperpolarization-activated cyclic nucleotide-gated channel 1-like isoform X1 [Danaus plexippus]|uniref:potassium/sodium hyperpolarization-activated cyclic nucleotide-gated channel 1-like isoform X1 n=1 Tax=Danaus plexippus TaxID=13037 RepID=UPI0013C4B3C6|nr:potassium/sodium hyperpolarization-activated cyclic nucleotide-gated channel 1-like isoform X1 [Danaus plexippus]
MSRFWNDFQASYHDHVCLIVTEKDVLEISLRGTNWVASFKRWWHDLFLLSHNDPRVRLFYGSSHAVRMDRLKQFRLYRSTIHPLSKFRHVWDIIMLFVVVLNMALFFHSTSNIYGEFDWSVYFIAVILEFIIFLDIYVTSRTGYINYESRKIVLNSKKVLIHYASTKLFAHVVSSLPLQCLLFLRYGRNINCSACKANKFVATLEILSIFRLYKLFDVTRYWNRQRSSFTATYFFKFLRIFVFGLATMLIIMNISDTINLLTIIATGNTDERSYFLTIFRLKHGEDKPLSNAMLICVEFARICKSFLLFSFSLKPRIYFLDKIASLFAYLVAMVFYMWSLIECYVCVGRLYFPENQLVMTVEETSNLIKWRQLPDSFARKVRKYYEFNMTRLSITEAVNGLYKNLPQSLRKDISLSSYTHLIIKIPYFAEWPSFLIQNIALLLQEEHYMQGDLVAQASVHSDGLIIIDVGVLGVYSINNEEKGHLIDGDYFCELSLVTDRELRMSSVVALTPSKILFLDKFLFRHLMRDHVELFTDMKNRLTSKYKSQDSKTNEQPNIVETY